MHTVKVSLDFLDTEPLLTISF